MSLCWIVYHIFNWQSQRPTDLFFSIKISIGGACSWYSSRRNQLRHDMYCYIGKWGYKKKIFGTFDGDEKVVNSLDVSLRCILFLIFIFSDRGNKNIPRRRFFSLTVARGYCVCLCATVWEWILRQFHSLLQSIAQQRRKGWCLDEKGNLKENCIFVLNWVARLILELAKERWRDERERTGSSSSSCFLPCVASLLSCLRFTVHQHS